MYTEQGTAFVPSHEVKAQPDKGHKVPEIALHSLGLQVYIHVYR